MPRPPRDPNAAPAEKLTPEQRTKRVLGPRILHVAKGIEQVRTAVLSRNYAFEREQIDKALDFLSAQLQELEKAVDVRFSGKAEKAEKPTVSFFD